MLKKAIHYGNIFFSMSLSRKRLLGKGILYSLQLEYYIRRNQGEQLKKYQNPTTETILQSADQRQRVAEVAKVVHIIDKRMPWNPMCLNLSLTARRLLRMQGIETTLHIGFKPREIGKDYKGHAWLTIEEQLITGWLADLAVYRELK
ncbi:MAG: lasso peptide biosynthesis B2 protein [Saprospiraceae bacterium]